MAIAFIRPEPRFHGQQATFHFNHQASPLRIGTTFTMKVPILWNCSGPKN